MQDPERPSLHIPEWWPVKKDPTIGGRTSSPKFLDRHHNHARKVNGKHANITAALVANSDVEFDALYTLRVGLIAALCGNTYFLHILKGSLLWLYSAIDTNFVNPIRM